LANFWYVAVLANLGYFRSFGKFWVFVKFGHFCHMWQFLAKFVILAYFDYVLILVTFANFGNCSPFWHSGTLCAIFWNLLIFVTLAILTGLSPFWTRWAILANCGYLPILIEFANFRKCCIFSHFGKGSPFWHVNNFVFFSANC
jgi:hypothetical protein